MLDEGYLEAKICHGYVDRRFSSSEKVVGVVGILKGQEELKMAQGFKLVPFLLLLPPPFPKGGVKRERENFCKVSCDLQWQMICTP